MQVNPLPISKRPVDIAIVIFFIINLLFITYIVDLEQLVIADPMWRSVHPFKTTTKYQAN
jgi:hypothetical protein